MKVQYIQLQKAELTSPPPLSTYGFQKLAVEYFAKGAFEQSGHALYNEK